METKTHVFRAAIFNISDVYEYYEGIMFFNQFIILPAANVATCLEPLHEYNYHSRQLVFMRSAIVIRYHRLQQAFTPTSVPGRINILYII